MTKRFRPTVPYEKDDDVSMLLHERVAMQRAAERERKRHRRYLAELYRQARRRRHIGNPSS